RISDRDDDRGRFFLFFSTQLDAAGPTNGRALFLSFALALLAFLFLRLDALFQIPRHSRAERRIVSSKEALALETLAAAAEWLRLDVHQRVLHRKHGGFLSQHFGLDRTQRCVVIENVNATTKCPDDEIVFSFLDIQVADGDRRHPTLKLNPLLAAVNGEEQTKLRTCKKQVGVHMIFRDGPN